jgi:hypothetical protein
MVCPIVDVPFSKVRELLDAVDAAKKSHDSGLAVDTLESLASQVRYAGVSGKYTLTSVAEPSGIRCFLIRNPSFFLGPGFPTHISRSAITILWHQNIFKKFSVFVLKEISFISFNFVKFMATKKGDTLNFFPSRVVIGSGIEYKSGSG